MAVRENFISEIQKEMPQNVLRWNQKILSKEGRKGDWVLNQELRDVVYP